MRLPRNKWYKSYYTWKYNVYLKELISFCISKEKTLKEKLNSTKHLRNPLSPVCLSGYHLWSFSLGMSIANNYKVNSYQILRSQPFGCIKVLAFKFKQLKYDSQVFFKLKIHKDAPKIMKEKKKGCICNKLRKI